MERDCVRSTSRSSSKAGGVGHELSGFMFPTRCGWVFDHSRAPDASLDRTQIVIVFLTQVFGCITIAVKPSVPVLAAPSR